MSRDEDPPTNSPEDIGYRGAPPAVMPRPGRKPATMATKQDEPKDEGARNFSVVLGQIGEGDLVEELSEGLHELVAFLKGHTETYHRDAKGSLTLVLAVNALGNGTITIAGDVKIKKPVKKRAGSTFFLTPGANLTLENPKQQKLPLREVQTKPTPTRDLPEGRPIRGL